MALQVNRVTNANIYLDGGSQLGRAEEFKGPDITQKMVEHKALGMVGTIELPSGIDKMTGEIKWSSVYPDALAKVANPLKAVSIQVRSNVQKFGPQGLVAEVPYVALLTVLFTKLPVGGFKQHDNVELTTPFSCYYVKVSIDGQDIVEFDAMANIYKVSGLDMLTQYRLNAGA